MRYGIFLIAFLFITISSCESSKAVDFKESIDQSERRAFEIILGKEGSGEKKLKCLEKDDYKCALIALDQQSIELDIVIADINKLSTEDITKAEPLKTASLEYYQSLKELHLFDRKEIEHQALLQTLKDDQLKNAQNNLMALAQQKKILYTKVYEKEAFLHTAAKDFETANGF